MMDNEQTDLLFRQLISRNWTTTDEAHAYNLAVMEASGTLTGEVIRYLQES